MEQALYEDLLESNERATNRAITDIQVSAQLLYQNVFAEQHRQLYPNAQHVTAESFKAVTVTLRDYRQGIRAHAQRLIWREQIRAVKRTRGIRQHVEEKALLPIKENA